MTVMTTYNMHVCSGKDFAWSAGVPRFEPPVGKPHAEKRF